MKILFLTILIYVCFSLDLKAQSTASARVIEDNISPRIILVFEKGKSKIIKLEKYNYIQKPDKTDSAMVKNQIIINNLIDDMKTSGYSVTSIAAITLPSHFEKFILFEKK